LNHFERVESILK